jgi:hypothetical protein
MISMMRNVNLRRIEEHVLWDRHGANFWFS